MHECTETHVFRDSTELQTIEREETPRLALVYDHEHLFIKYICYEKINLVIITISRKINDYKSFLNAASFYYVVSFLIIISTKQRYVMVS